MCSPKQNLPHGNREKTHLWEILVQKNLGCKVKRFLSVRQCTHASQAQTCAAQSQLPLQGPTNKQSGAHLLSMHARYMSASAQRISTLLRAVMSARLRSAISSRSLSPWLHRSS